MVNWLAEYASAQPLASRSPTANQLLEIRMEATELRPRLVLETIGNKKDFDEFLRQERAKEKKIERRTSYIFGGIWLSVMAILVIFINVYIQFTIRQAIARSPDFDELRQLMVSFLQKNIATWNMVLVWALIVVAIWWTLSSTMHGVLSALTTRYLKPLLFNTPAYQKTYQSIHLSVTAYRKAIPMMWVVVCGIGAVSLVWGIYTFNNMLQKGPEAEFLWMAISQLINVLIILSR